MKNKTQQKGNDSIPKDMVGKSFLQDKERLDVIDMIDDQFLVRRTKDHPFLQGKKAVKEEKWNVVDFNNAVNNGTLTNIPTYTYTTNQKAYELNEINLRNKGLVTMLRNDNGLTLTFDHPVTSAEMGLSNLTPTTETAARLADSTTTQSQQQTTHHTSSPTAKVRTDSQAQTESPSQALGDVPSTPPLPERRWPQAGGEGEPTQVAQNAHSTQGTQHAQSPDPKSQGNDVTDPKDPNNLKVPTGQTQKPNDSTQKVDIFLKQFNDFKAKHPDALLLFHMGDSYVTYQQDAKKAAQILGITPTRNNNRKDPHGKPIEMAGFPQHALDAFLPKLIRAGQRVAICDQLEKPTLNKNKEQNHSQQTQNPETRADSQAQTESPSQARAYLPLGFAASLVEESDRSKIGDVPSTSPLPERGWPHAGGEGEPTQVAPNAHSTQGTQQSQSPDQKAQGNDVNDPKDSNNLKVPTPQHAQNAHSTQGTQQSQSPDQKAQSKDVNDPKDSNNLKVPTTPNAQISTTSEKQSLIEKISKTIGKNKGIALTGEPHLMTKTSKGVEFEANRIIREDTGNIRVYGLDAQGKERSVPVERVNNETLSKIVELVSSGKNIFLNSQENTTAQNQREIEQSRKNSPNLSKRHERLITQITEIIGDGRGVGISPKMPIMARSVAGDEFPVDMILKDRQGDIRLVGRDFLGYDRSVTLQKAGERTLEEILKHLYSSNLKNVKHPQQEDRRDGEKHKTSQATTLEVELINRMEELGMDRFKFNPIKVHIDDPTQDIDKNVDIIKIIADLKDPIRNITLVDKDFNSYGMEWVAPNDMLRFIQKVTNLFNNAHGLQNTDQKAQGNDVNDLKDPNNLKAPTDPTDNPNQTANVSQTAPSRQNRKLLAAEKVHSAAKNDFPDEMVFVRLRNPESKKLMYQTFGKDTETLQNISPSAPVEHIEIKRKQHPVVSLQQENLDAVRADLMTHNMAPVIINAKGAIIENDHFLAFSPEERQNFIAQQQITQNNNQNVSSQPDPKSQGSNVTDPKDPNNLKVPTQQNQAQVQADLRSDRSAPTDLPLGFAASLVEESAGNKIWDMSSPNPSQTAQTVQTAQQTQGTQQSQAPADQAQQVQTDVPSPSTSQSPDQKAQGSDVNDLKDPNNLKVPTVPTVQSQKPNDSSLSPDNLYQYLVKRNSHYPGVFDIRLYVNGEKAGAHRMTEQDRDLWREQKVKIEDLMVKYFGEELGVSQFPNMSFFKGDNEQQNSQQTRQTEASLEKIKNYDARAKYHQQVSQNQNNDSLVLLRMQTKDGNTFFQAFNKDADIAADILNRKTIAIGDNRYVSLTEKDTARLTEHLGNKIVVADYNPHTSLGQTLTPSRVTKNDLPEIKPNTRVEYVISPVMNTNKETRQQERVPGVFALAVTVEGKTLGRKTLTKEERDLLDRKPSEITNVINNKFEKELQGMTLSFKQVHRPAVSNEQWNNRDMGNGLTLDYSRVTNNSSENRYEMTAKINGVTYGPKPMYKQEVNDFFDKARPLTEIVAKVFRDELQSMGQNTTQQAAIPKISGSQAMDIWHKAHEDGNNAKIAFVQREGRYGVFYQTFGEDAKNMSKVTNRSLKVTDTETKKNVIYASIPEDQILATFKQLRSKGFQPFAINTKGEPVSIVPEQKVSNPKSISLGDGRKVDDISLRNTGGKWIMTASIDGNPMPQREISMEDAKTFKQGLQTMSDILTKYFKNDLAQQQDSTKKGRGR